MFVVVDYIEISLVCYPVTEVTHYKIQTQVEIHQTAYIISHFNQQKRFCKHIFNLFLKIDITH
jgi:hypothetical protein